MGRKRASALPPGRQPYDPANGLRVGGFTGGLTAAVVSVALSLPPVATVAAGTLIGAAAGYVTERRKLGRS